MNNWRYPNICTCPNNSLVLSLSTYQSLYLENYGLISLALVDSANSLSLLQEEYASLMKKMTLLKERVGILQAQVIARTINVPREWYFLSKAEEEQRSQERHSWVWQTYDQHATRIKNLSLLRHQYVFAWNASRPDHSGTILSKVFPLSATRLQMEPQQQQAHPQCDWYY